MVLQLTRCASIQRLAREVVAADPAEEDTFTFGPDLVDQLRRKIRTTMEHWLDFDRLYPRPNR